VGRNQRPSEGLPFTVKTGAARVEELDPPSSSVPASCASTSPRRRLLPPRRRATPPFYTDAYATARGHRGENKLLLPSEDASAFEPGGGTRRSHRTAAAGDVSHQARMGNFLRAQHRLFSLPCFFHALAVPATVPLSPSQSLPWP
jgi:hypothetical protein